MIRFWDFQFAYAPPSVSSLFGPWTNYRRLDEDKTMSSGQPDDAASTEREQRQRRMRRVQVAMAVFATCIGLGSFFRVAGKDRFETYHTLDVIQLMTAGAGFGVALVLLVQFFKFRNSGSDDKKG